jgi:hypothetical protein
MKRKYLFPFSCLMLLLSISLYSCKKKDPSINSYFLNYQIPEVPVTSNYLVGAFYYTFSTWNANIQQVPTIGTYTTPSTGVVPTNVIQAHIADAGVAKIDYFIFQVRSPTLDVNGYKTDSTIVNSFVNSPNSSSMNFVVSYNMSTSTLGISNSGNPDANGNPRGVALEASAAKLAGFYNDFVRLAFWFKKANYQKVNGKWLILMNHAQDLNSSMDPANPGSNAPLYAELRKRLSAIGFDVFMVGEQDQWSDVTNYYYRYQNCLDAVYEANMTDNRGVVDRNYLFAQFCDQSFAYWKTQLESWPAGGLQPGANKMEFVPCIEAGYNYQIGSATSTSLDIPHTADGAFYRTYTNIAKRNASKSKLVFIDSFNNFSIDTQIEPTQSYGTTYLDITRDEFKVK